MIFIRNSVLITGALNDNGLTSSVEQFARRSGRRNLQLKRLRDLLSLGETHRAQMHSDTKKPRRRVKVVLLSSFINIGFLARRHEAAAGSSKSRFANSESMSSEVTSG